MRKLLSALVILVMFTLRVSANSGPATWHSSPMSESFRVSEDSHIEVLSEQLTFEMPYEPVGEHQLNLSTTATYEMHNTSLDAEVVTMAFPFVGRMTEVSMEDILITVDGQPLAYEIYPGDQVHGRSSGYDTGAYYEFDEDEIIGNINDVTYRSYQLNNEIEGTHFSLHATSKSPTMKVRVTMPVLSASAKAIAVGPTNAFSDAGYLYFEGLCTRSKPFEIFVYGGEASIRVVAFEEGKDQKGLNSSNYEVSQKDSDYGDFYKEAIDPQAKKAFNGVETTLGKVSAFDSSDRYNILTKLFKEALGSDSTRAITATEPNKYLDQFSPDRYMTLVYDVAFEGDDYRKVSVRYTTLPSYDTTSGDRVLYSFDYLLSPAARWKSFKDLTIDIHTDRMMGDLVESTLDFERKDDDHYTANYDRLPETELRMTFEGPAIEDQENLSEEETLSFKEKYGLDIFEEKLDAFDGVFDRDWGIRLDLADIIGMVIGLILLIAGVWILIIRRNEGKR